MSLCWILKIVLLVYFICGSATSSDDDDVDGYYWRDYKGIVPKDAFKAAYSNDNKPLYVGQVLHRDQLIPARIDPFVQQVFYEWGYTEYVPRDDQNVKIFCSRHPEQLQWIHTGNGIIQNVHGKIEAGYEVNTTLYIGRKFLDGEYTVGKIISGRTQSTLNTSKDGKVRQHGEFEVLIFNPNIDKVSQYTSVSNNSVQSNNCIKKQIVINYYT